MLIDPTSACNIKCKGCWAADYSRSTNISYEKLDNIFTEAKHLGVMDVMMSGGEPLMRKDEVLSLAAKHNKLTFTLFTNGTLIDKEFADALVNTPNIGVLLSIEGFREETDFRRGDGIYNKVLEAMALLKERDLGFGFSVCYHSKNFDVVCSDRFLDFMREKGAWIGWFFNYIPIGSDADTTLCCTAEQRAFVMEQIEKYWRKNNFTLIDFANSGHKSIGCVAAGNDFIHINSNGDVEPCAFCHYSDTNINDKTLLEALRSPFFKHFRQRKPFSNNFLTPCPMMDVPEEIVKLTSNSSVKSTHIINPESGMELAAKTQPIADAWRPVAEKIYEKLPEDQKRRFGILNRIVHSGNKLKTGD